MKEEEGSLSKKKQSLVTFSGSLLTIRAYVIVFLIAAATGELDPLEYIYSRVFPVDNSFSTLHLETRDVSGTPLPPLGNRSMIDAMLLRHDHSANESVTIFRHENERTPALFAGALGVTPTIKSADSKLLGSQVMLKVDLPPETLLVMLAYDPTENGTGKRQFYFSNSIIEKEFQDKADIVLYTKNEVRRIHIAYIMTTLLLVLVGVTIPWFSRIIVVNNEGDSAPENSNSKPSAIDIEVIN